MKQPFHLLLFILLFLAACGHSAEILEDSNAKADVSDWKTLRADAAANPQTNPSTSAPPLLLNTDQPLSESEPDNPLDAFIQQFALFSPGRGSRYGSEDMETWLLGPPYGGGRYVQSGDVVSLGNGGEIILGFPRFFPIDGPGPDFIVFENAFQPVGSSVFYVEPGIVGVSQDGVRFVDFPCSSAQPYDGCAGTHPVLANPDRNAINPRNPATAGGEAYNLADVGLNYIRYIRIRDSGLNLGGESAVRTGQAGFDLDAIAIVHGAKP